MVWKSQPDLETQQMATRLVPQSGVQTLRWWDLPWETTYEKRALLRVHGGQLYQRSMGNKLRECRHAHACGARILLSSWRCSGMCPTTEMFEWKRAGPLGRTGRGVEKVVLPSMSVSSWRTWSFTQGWMSSWQESLWVRNKGRVGTGDIVVGICYGWPVQEDQMLRVPL